MLYHVPEPEIAVTDRQTRRFRWAMRAHPLEAIHEAVQMRLVNPRTHPLEVAVET